MTESQIQRSITDYLAARRIMAFRMNSGVAKMDGRFVRFGVPGMADILAFRKVDGYPEEGGGSINVLWIECKAPKGLQSQLQRSFQQQVEAEGHVYILARSIEDVEAVL